MKTNISKSRFLYFFILLFLMIFFNRCDRSDDEPLPTTFLEKYHGTTRKGINTKSYMRFNNNLATPIDTWGWDWVEDCYYYNTCYTKANAEIIENSLEKLTLEWNWCNAYDHDTFTIVGDTIIVQNNGNDGFGHSWVLLYYYNQTTDDLNTLPICN